MRVGIFDSGIGGLTVLKAFTKRYPNNEYIYYGDTLNMPYGSKTKKELFELVKPIIKFLEISEVDIIIIACGTVSSNLYEAVKQSTNIPIYNVIDPTIEYIKENNFKNVLVFATETTINSHVFKDKLGNVNITEVACPKLVPLIEANKTEELKETVIEYIPKDKKFDAFVFGCTHYPLIKDLIKSHFDSFTTFIDMGEVLSQNINLQDSTSNIQLTFSSENEMLNENVYRILTSEI